MIDLSVKRVLLDHFAAKKGSHSTRGLNDHACYTAVTAKNCEEDELVAWPERQMMLAIRIIHIHWVFLYTTFQRI